MNAVKFQVIYNNEIYPFEYGSQVYIFHTGIYNDMQRYGIKQLLKYVDFVQLCYLKDSNRTPLGELADYIAEHWKTVRNKNYYGVLDEFYSQN